MLIMVDDDCFGVQMSLAEALLVGSGRWRKGSAVMELLLVMMMMVGGVSLLVACLGLLMGSMGSSCVLVGWAVACQVVSLMVVADD